MQPIERNTGIQDLGEGLILRQGQPDDLEALVAFHQKIQGEGEWTRILADGTHPTTGINDFTIVEDTHTGAIVSSMCMIPQEWSYRGIAFGVARLEMVSTDPDYRWRGLVRAQFDFLHKRSAGMGHLVQVVVGRPWVYRKFGYTMALRYWDRLQVSLHGVPALEGDQVEPYRVRPAQEADIPFCAAVFDRRRDRFLVTCNWDEDFLHHFIFRRKYEGPLQLRVIEDLKGDPAGAILHAPELDDGLLTVLLCEIMPGVSWVEAAPTILRYFKSAGERYAVDGDSSLEGFNLGLGPGHPLKAFLSCHMQHVPPLAPFAWYVRVGDIPAFLRKIAPVLEERLAGSVMAGYTGKLRLCFYSRGSGIALSFDRGRLVSVEACPVEWAESAIPVEMFIQLLFGYKSLQELEDYSKEVFILDPVRLLVQVLFPKQDSAILSVQ